MSDDKKFTPFDKSHAASYDRVWTPLAPMRDALHLLTRFALSELPQEARILCVGAGTGAEILYLAGAFPGWRFTGVDPSAPMLEVCRRRVEEAGVSARCTLHHGTLGTLPESEPFDGATSLLVSQFLVDVQERRGFFSEVRARLRLGAPLVSADLSSDMSSADYRRLLGLWRRALKFCELPDAQVEKAGEAYGRDVAVLPQREIASIIESAGFSPPVLFAQTALIHAWLAEAVA